MEKRIQDRMSLYYYLKVHNAQDQSLIGHMVDFNTQGIRLMSEQAIAPGTKFTMQMVLPEVIHGRKILEFEAVCRHSAQALNPDHFESGFQISLMPEEYYPLVKDLIGRFAMGKN